MFDVSIKLPDTMIIYTISALPLPETVPIVLRTVIELFNVQAMLSSSSNLLGNQPSPQI